MKFGDDVYKSMGMSSYLSNSNYFLHAKQDLDFLNNISCQLDKSIPYTSSLVSMAVNVLEREIK